MNTENLTKKCVEVTEILKSITHPARLKILCFLTEGKKSVKELEMLAEISQSATSQYLMDMWRQSLLEREKIGQVVYYAIKDQRLFELMRSLNEIFCKGDKS
jgi:DNA-binding transcriptional ArsR family regulator